MPPDERPDAKPLAFRCPICRCSQYERLATAKTAVYACVGCSTLFRDPEKFTRFDPNATTPPAPDFKRGWSR
jgi:hypothetical protein